MRPCDADTKADGGEGDTDRCQKQPILATAEREEHGKRRHSHEAEQRSGKDGAIDALALGAGTRDRSQCPAGRHYGGEVAGNERRLLVKHLQEQRDEDFGPGHGDTEQRHRRKQSSQRR